MDMTWLPTGAERVETARPGFVIVQWLATPDEGRRAQLLAALDPLPVHSLAVRTERGVIELFCDAPDLVVETSDALLTATSQNVNALLADISFLGKGTPLQDRVQSLQTPFRNETLVRIDKQNLEIKVLTDPIGFSKMFHLLVADARLISSSINPLIPLSPGVDQSSVVSYLLNGSPLSNRTVYLGITTLKRASVHRFTTDASDKAIYWNYSPLDADAGPRDLDKLQADLWDAIVESIRSQCAGKRVLLPLSGGFDSSVILGVLGKILRHPNVICFSYANGPVVPGSDAHVAKRQAALFGYPHVNLDISNTTLIDVLELNREAGQLQRGPCLEITAYADLKRIVGEHDEMIMPFGDEFFGGGWNSYSLEREEDILGAVYLRSPKGLDPLERYTKPNDLDALKSQLSADYSEIIEIAHGFGNLYSAREYIYLDQRIAMNLLPLRTFSIGHWFDICTPLLDVSIIDQIVLLAPEHRADKVFFKSMAHRLLPEIFSTTRSSHRQVVPALGAKMGEQLDRLVELAEREEWRIPGLIEADNVLELIRSAAAAERRRASIRSRIEVSARKLMSAAGILEGAKRLRYRYSSPFDERPDSLTVLTRILSLAQQTAGAGRS